MLVTGSDFLKDKHKKLNTHLYIPRYNLPLKASHLSGVGRSTYLVNLLPSTHVGVSFAQPKLPLINTSDIVKFLQKTITKNLVKASLFVSTIKHLLVKNNSLKYSLTGSRRCYTNQPILLSKYNIPLTLRLIGFFVSQKVRQTQTKYFRFKYLFKKNYFSFLAPNQVKKKIMIQKKKIVISRMVLNLRRYAKPKTRFTYTYFNNTYNLVTRLNKNLTTLERGTLNTLDIFTSTMPTSCVGRYSLQYHTLDEVMDQDVFYNKGNDCTFNHGEVRVPRVKFKPGYQRMWRRVRTALKDSLRLRFLYQKQLTKYLSQFYGSSKKYALSQNKTTFDKVVVYSRLLPDMTTCKVFLDAQLLYLNGSLVFDANGYTGRGDVIQLTVSLWYYILYRWLFN